ncbi:hypothetical protein ABGB07_36120 [Micromonosporaceae bacterium B7E4]
MPTKFVRIRDKATGVESSVSDRRAEQLKARAERNKDHPGVEILADVPAVDALGRALPPTAPSPKPTVKSKEQAR